MNQELREFVDLNNTLDSTQHGFRSRHSTESALIMAMEEIRRVMEEGGRAVLILLDLTAAFDTVNHGVLLERLKDVGITDIALTLLRSILDSRVQQIYWDGIQSEEFHLPCGVPQGSALSPTLFNLYVTPLAKLIKDLQLVSYADDTQLVVSLIQSVEVTAERFRNCLISVKS